MLSLNFYSARELMPELNQAIVYVWRNSDYIMDGLTDIREGVVEGVWVELENGTETGNEVTATAVDCPPDDGLASANATHELKLMIDSERICEELYWMPLDDFWRAFYAAPNPITNSVKIPSSEEEAALMVSLGADWLNTHAPHRLNQPSREDKE